MNYCNKNYHYKFTTFLLGLVFSTIFTSSSLSASDNLQDIASKFKDATSYYLLAQKYSISGGSPTDFEQAIKWYTEAAKLGHVKSKLQLGRFYFEGLGTDIDYDEAARWLIDPANEGYNKAQYMLGMIYLNGTKKIAKDERKAFSWLRKAADDFNIDAIYQVGRMYYYGIGIDISLNTAKKYLTLAQEQEIAGAAQLLAQIKHEEQTPQESPVVAAQKTAAELLLESASTGDVNSQYQLAKAYLNGDTGIKRNTKKALLWLERAALRGQKDAQYMLGSIYYNGNLTKRNSKKAKFWLNKASENGVENAKVLMAAINSPKQTGKTEKKAKHPTSTEDLFLSAAENGDKEAQFKVGLMYLYGQDGYPRDPEQALRWIKASANQNHVGAQFQTGMAYYDPNLDNNQEAQSWLIKAAENGHADAQYFLGTIYNKQQNYDSAVHWLDVAVRNNHDEALDLLIEMYINNKLANPDKDQLLTWLEKASLNGFREAQYELGKQYLVHEEIANNKKKAFAWIEKAARKGHLPAKYQLAVMYQKGAGAPQQYTKSARWFREAAKQGHMEAQYELSELYSQGLGLPKSARKAKKWYEAAAEQGHMKAKVRLGSGARF
ncbi:MAG: SEL1-like repeat protein [Gammaproteobacteria bacterium]